jgi:type II secretory pathway component PulF
MKTFYYKAKEGPQKVVEGRMEAATRDQVVQHLTQQGLFPLEITSESVRVKRGFRLAFFVSKKPSRREIIDFLDQLAELSQAGLPLLRALEMISRQPQKEAWSEILIQLKDSVRGGMSFSEAVERYPAVFSRFMVSMIRAGEQSGTFEVSLKEILTALEREEEVAGKIRQASIYPGIILTVGMITVSVLVLFVIPRLEDLYRDFGGTLPWFTRIVIGSSRLAGSYGWLAALLLIGGIIYGRMDPKKARSAGLARLAKLPWIGSLARLEDHAHFTRTLGLLLKHGVPIVEALEASSQVIQNRNFRDRSMDMRDAVTQGKSLARAMSDQSLFEAFVVNFVETGEETGTLDHALTKVAEIHEKAIDQKLKIAATLIEPALILVVGVIVGAIVIAMLLPIFEVSFLVS